VVDEPASEQALAILWREVAQEHFLRRPTAAEALAALEQRRKLVQQVLGLEEAQPSLDSGAAHVIVNHFHTLPTAESAWLEHALTSVRRSMDDWDQS
jgi:hypothetical protein